MSDRCPFGYLGFSSFVSSWADFFLFGETLVSFVPMFHVSGLFGGCFANARACLNVLMSRFDMEEYMRLIQIYKVC